MFKTEEILVTENVEIYRITLSLVKFRFSTKNQDNIVKLLRVKDTEIHVLWVVATTKEEDKIPFDEWNCRILVTEHSTQSCNECSLKKWNSAVHEPHIIIFINMIN